MTSLKTELLLVCMPYTCTIRALFWALYDCFFLVLFSVALQLDIYIYIYIYIYILSYISIYDSNAIIVRIHLLSVLKSN